MLASPVESTNFAHSAVFAASENYARDRFNAENFGGGVSEFCDSEAFATSETFEATENFVAGEAFDGDKLLRVANEIIADRRLSRQPRTFLHEVLSRADTGNWSRPIDPARIFDAYAFHNNDLLLAQLELVFESVALACERLIKPLQIGDILIRRLDGGYAQVAIIADSRALSHWKSMEKGLTPETYHPGNYVQVVEGGARPHRLNNKFARRISDESNRLPFNQIVLRVRGSKTNLIAVPETTAAFDSSLESLAETVNRRSQQYVRWIQESLNQLINAGLAVDGINGERTKAAVRQFQSQHELTPDGIVGARTKAALIAAGATAPPRSNSNSNGSGGGARPATANCSPIASPPRPITADFVSRVSSAQFVDAAQINDFFRRTTGSDFVDWFNQNIAQRENWSGRRIGGSRDLAAVKDRFNRIWSRIPEMFSTTSINLFQFLCLTSIVINETGGSFSPITERVGRAGHPGIAYAFDRIPNLKRSYNGGGNKTAFELFNDRDFIAATVICPLAANSETRPKDDFPTSTDPAITGFILEADFYKFRGRGFIQTTFREGYIGVIRYIQSNQINQSVVNEYQQRWANQTPNQIATITTNIDWDRLFQQSDFLVPVVAIRLHSRNSHYLNLPLDASRLNGMAQGSIFYVGYRVSGGCRYAELFLRRVTQMVESLMQRL